MEADFDDLIPLFIKEGHRRLERLIELAPQVLDPSVAAEARRELHTLKGSSRMLNQRRVAELCHSGENLLQAPDEEARGDFIQLIDNISQRLDSLGRGLGDEAAPTARESVPEAVEELMEVAEHRISADAADRLAGGASALRLLALAGLKSGARLTDLVTLAESGIHEQDSHQVLALVASNLRQMATDFEVNQRRLLQHAELQVERLLDLQLQPLRPFLQNLARHARELARQLGKEIEVDVQGGEARLDQRISSELQGAFLHLVRNAVDHGVETPAAREAAGKPRHGRVRIEATSHGDRVEIVVADDGAGVDPGSVLAAARKAGLVDPETTDLSSSEIFQLLFTTGFTTRHQVSEVSGRGVGLDAVASVVRHLGGEVWLDSERGLGSSVFVEVPAARRGERVLVLGIGNHRLALPKSVVRRVDPSPEEGLAEGDGGPLVEIDGQLQRVLPLHGVLGQEEAVAQPVLISVRVGGTDRVIAADMVESEEEVLVRPFAQSSGMPSYYTGMALLPSGEPVAVLAPRVLVTQMHVRSTRIHTVAPHRLRVLLVEDSLVTREMERRMLEEEGFQVIPTANAEEALSQLGEKSFDCMVTDLEMPGMSGLDLTRQVRGMDRLGQLPIIVVSTRDRPGDRMAGLEAGADAYISKQVLESRKLATIIRRLGSREG